MDDMNNQHRLPSNLLWPGAKTTLHVFTFPLDGINDAGRSLIEYAKEYPWLFGISSVLIAGGILFLTLPVIVGFAQTGPVAGSLAALWQSWIGNVVEGSLFAVLQSLAMKGVFVTIGEAMIAMGLASSISPLVPVSAGSYYGGSGAAGVMVPAAMLAAYFVFPGV